MSDFLKEDGIDLFAVDEEPEPNSNKPVSSVRAKSGTQAKAHGGGMRHTVKVTDRSSAMSKKRSGVFAFAAFAALAVIVGVFMLRRRAAGSTNETEPTLVAVQESYELSGRYALDRLLSALNNYNAEDIDGVVGAKDGDSYLAQEWAYVNLVKLRQEFLKRVGAVVRFEYPMVQQKSTTGVGMTNDDGSPVMIESYMNNGEAMKVTVPDWDTVYLTMEEKRSYIGSMYYSSKYSVSDYTYSDELTNLMLQFILDDGEIPTKQVNVALRILKDSEGNPYIESDEALDDLLFGSESLRDCMTKFSQICTGWTGYKDEYYTEQEWQHNTEYDRWFELFIKYFEADGGIYDPDSNTYSNVKKSFKKGKSKWEPWYVYDSAGKIQKDENGDYLVEYFTVYDEDGAIWKQPDVEVLVDVEKVRQVEDQWVMETGIVFNSFGVHYLQTEYSGIGLTVTRVGDGSREHPAGIGTTLITKLLCDDGRYHDVRVALLGYWTDQDAIDYAEKFSSKNRGFTTASVIKLICYEVYVENLESEPITFSSSEMTLTDRNSNVSSRTGTMYGFTGTETLGAGESMILNDWATSTELAQKYVCWGKSFGRQFEVLYFDALAGTGVIPSYSAYQMFTGQSSIDESIRIGE